MDLPQGSGDAVLQDQDSQILHCVSISYLGSHPAHRTLRKVGGGAVGAVGEPAPPPPRKRYAEKVYVYENWAGAGLQSTLQAFISCTMTYAPL